jgi:oligosaccharide repeat unit polymerase
MNGTLRQPSRLNLANPALIYTIVWILALTLAFLRLTTNLDSINGSTLFLILSNCASFWLLYALFSASNTSHPSMRPSQISPVVMESLMRFVKRLLFFWLVGVVVTISYQEGLPLLWAFNQSDQNYIDFGIPTLHGLLNSIYMFSFTALFLDYLVRRNRTSLYLLLVLFVWVVLAFARSVLLGVICQSVGIYLLLHGISAKALLKLVPLMMVVVILFGAIGEYRGTGNQLMDLVEDPYYEAFQRVPSGFLWFYVYLTAPLSNLNYNVDTVQPDYTPYYSVANLFPTVIREKLFSEGFVRGDDFVLVNDGLNVSTWYAGYVSDFGMGISIVIVAFIQFAILVFYFHAKRYSVWAIIGYSVLFQCIVFSVFYNLLSSQVYILQLLFAMYFGFRVRHLAQTGSSAEDGPASSAGWSSPLQGRSGGR